MNPYLIIAALIALAASYGWGRYDGRQIEAAAWQEREVRQQAAHAAATIELQTQAREEERDSALRAAMVSAHYQKELINAKSQRDRALADLRAGRLVLRDPGAPGGAACDGAQAAAGAGAGGRDGAPPGELPAARAGVLSDRAAEFIVGILGEADEVARQLTACQAQLRADRGEAPPP